LVFLIGIVASIIGAVIGIGGGIFIVPLLIFLLKHYVIATSLATIGLLMIIKQFI